jgi:hypothetical protein
MIVARVVTVLGVDIRLAGLRALVGLRLLAAGA